MGSRSAAKAGRSKAVSNAGNTKGSVKSSSTDGKQGQGEETEEFDDLSVLRKSVGTSVNGLLHALKVFQTGTEEIRSLLSQECKVIYECRVCDNLFRSLANFLSHKRIYCKGFASALHPSGSSPCQPNGLLPYGGHVASAGESQPDGSLEMVIVQPEPPPPKRQRNESPDHWLCNEATPSTDSTFDGPLPKLECSVPPIRRRKDICGVIEKLSKRASRQNLANATAVASHFASYTGGKLCLDNAVTTSTSNALYMENIGETQNAVYQTLLCASSSSMKLSFPPSGSEHSIMPCIRETGSSVDMKNPDSIQDCMPSSLTRRSSLSAHLSDPSSSSVSGISNCAPSFPTPHNLLIKNRVALMKEAVTESESGVLGPDGVLIPAPKTNGPMYPPEVCSGGVSNSEGEEVEDEDEDGEEVSPKGKSKVDPSKGQSPEEKEEIICSICKAKFSTRKTLSHHMKSLHVMFRTYYRCPCCKNCFANNWSVYRHLYKVHRKTTDQVRKLRALIKKKAFRKKIIVPLPNSSSSQQPSQPIASNQPKDSSTSVQSSTVEKTSSPPTTKSSSSSASSASKIVSSAPGRSGSPLPPPSEATQFPAISAQHAQVLRKLENIVKQEDNNWRLESFPERPGMGQSCPGCNRRFERRAALASHAHSCHKRILLAAQKASRARNKQQQQKMAKPAVTGAGLGDAGKNGKDLPKSKEATAGKHQDKPGIVRIKFGKNQAGIVNFHRGGVMKKEENSSEDEEEAQSPGTSSYKHAKTGTHKGGELHSQCAIGHKPLPDISVQSERLKEEGEGWEEMERPNSASSFGTHRDSSSPLTIPTHPGRQQRIGIQIRKDYVKGERVSVCSSGPSPPPYPPLQVSKEEEDADDEVVVLSSSFPKANTDSEVESSKESSMTTSGKACPDTEEGDGVDITLQSCSDGEKQAAEKEELDDEEAAKTTSMEESAIQSDEDNSSMEDQTSSSEVKVGQMTEDPVETSQVESIIGSHGEVKRVFLEVIVGGVADPNSLAVDEEEGGKEDDGDLVKKEEKRDAAEEAGCPHRGPNTRGKPPPSLMIPSQQRQGGRPVRNRVKVEREDFIYDLSDMKLSPTKREDMNAGSSLTTMKKPRRNLSQQQMVSGVSQGSNGSSVGGPSAVRQVLVPGVNKVEGSGRAQSSGSLNIEGGHSLRVYSGKAIGRSSSADKSVKVPVSMKGSFPPPVAPPKLGDCRVVIGGLRSGDMTQLSVRRVYSSSRKVLSPSNMTPVAVESEESITYSSSKKCPPSKDCSIESSEVDEGLFVDVSKIEAPVSEKPVVKTSSLLYQSDSLDSGDSVSDFGSVPHANSPIESNELNPTT